MQVADWLVHLYCTFLHSDCATTAESPRWWAQRAEIMAETQRACWGQPYVRPQCDVCCAVCYCMAGIQLYWFSPINTVETLDQYNIITGIGFGGGSICFFVGATLLLARQVRPYAS